MYGFLNELVEYHLYIENNDGLNIDHWATPLFMVSALKKTLSNETKKARRVR